MAGPASVPGSPHGLTNPAAVGAVAGSAGWLPLGKQQAVHHNLRGTGLGLGCGGGSLLATSGGGVGANGSEVLGRWAAEKVSVFWMVSTVYLRCTCLL